MEKLSDQLMNDFKVVVADTESLLKGTAHVGGEKMAEVRTKAEKSLSIAKTGMKNAQASVVAKAKQVAKATDECVHESPWKAIGSSAGLGLVIGVVIGLLIDRR